MKARVTVALVAAILGVAAPVSSVMAFDVGAFGVHDRPEYTACPASSASANWHNVPVKQYDQTSGGTRC